MSRLQLEFCEDGDRSELVATSFERPAGSSELRCIRGATPIPGQTGSFPRSSAVKARVLLLVRCKLYESGVRASLKGGSGSAAPIVGVLL